MDDHQEAKLPGVMHVVWSLGIAGAEKLAYDMAVHLPEQGFRPVACCIEHDGPLRERFAGAGVPVHYLKPQSGLDWNLVAWLRRLVISEGIDVVHAHQYNPFFYSSLALLGLPVNLVYTEHGRLFPECPNWKRMLINPLLGRRIDHIVSISFSTKTAMAKYDRFPARRIRVIHNGVDLHNVVGRGDPGEKRRELGIPQGFDLIGTAARFDEVKNLPMMLRAFRHVLAVRPRTLLLLAGTGPLEDELKGVARELGIVGQVRFLGLRNDLPDLLKIFSVFLLSSFTEGISITLLEAMANALPAVVTDVGGNSEVVVEGQTGHLVPVGDDEGMAEKIVWLLDNRRSAREMGDKGQRRVRESFSFEGMMSSYLELYRDHGQRRSRPGWAGSNGRR